MSSLAAYVLGRNAARASAAREYLGAQNLARGRLGATECMRLENDTAGKILVRRPLFVSAAYSSTPPLHTKLGLDDLPHLLTRQCPCTCISFKNLLNTESLLYEWN